MQARGAALLPANSNKIWKVLQVGVFTEWLHSAISWICADEWVPVAGNSKRDVKPI
jgi:hypothetical protein